MSYNINKNKNYFLLNNNVIISNRYKIVRSIDKGSYGSIYKAIDLEKNKYVAIKQIKNIKNFYDEEKFNNEIDIMIQLKSLYSVKLLDKFVYDNYFYIVMELYDTNLKNYVNEKNGLTINEICQILYQLNFVFLLMYENKIIHRDLKPENILIKYINDDKNNIEIKLSDYGLGKIINENDLINKKVGTELTMAPEVFLGKKYNHKADLWSIGVIIYFMYFNEYPFQNSNELLNGKLKKIPIDEEFKNLLLSLLKVEVVERISWKNFLKHPFILKYINKKMIDKEYYNFENEINNFFSEENFENLLKKYPPFNDNNKYEVKKKETNEFKYYGEVIKINNKFIPHGRGLIHYKEFNIYFKGQIQNGKGKGNCSFFYYSNQEVFKENILK